MGPNGSYVLAGKGGHDSTAFLMHKMFGPKDVQSFSPVLNLTTLYFTEGDFFAST